VELWLCYYFYRVPAVYLSSTHSSTNIGSKESLVGLKVVDAIEMDHIKIQESPREVEGEQACVGILVTGSLYLVGSALEAGGREEGE